MDYLDWIVTLNITYSQYEFLMEFWKPNKAYTHIHKLIAYQSAISRIEMHFPKNYYKLQELKITFDLRTELKLC